jgi:hypothetical protein
MFRSGRNLTFADQETLQETLQKIILQLLIHRKNVSLNLILKLREYMMVTAFWCAATQEEQDKVDDEEREAMENLVQTWLEKLRLIIVIVSKATMFYQAPPLISSDNILCFD